MSVKRTQAGTPDRPEWVRYLEGYCGVKTYNAWRDWTDFITTGPGGLTECPSDRELLETVKFVSGQDDVSFANINARKLAGWVKWYRKSDAAGRHGWNRETPEGNLDAVWQMMLRAHDFESRWELLCEGGEPIAGDPIGRWTPGGWGVRQCNELEARARNKWPDWDNDKRRMMASIGPRTIMQAATIIAGNMDVDVDNAPF